MNLPVTVEDVVLSDNTCTVEVTYRQRITFNDYGHATRYFGQAPLFGNPATLPIDQDGNPKATQEKHK